MRRSIPIGRPIGCLLVGTVLLGCAPATPSDEPSAPSTVTSAGPSTAAPAPGTVIVDPSLLAILPEAVDGIALEADPETAADIARDQTLSSTATAIAVALAIAPTGSGATDLAIVNVVQLRPGAFDDAFFRSWRDTYDEGACEAAGGVSGNAETVIGGRTTYLGSCAGGARTYHVYLPERDALVSITAAGERRLGELVVAGLAE